MCDISKNNYKFPPWLVFGSKPKQKCGFYLSVFSAILMSVNSQKLRITKSCVPKMVKLAHVRRDHFKPNIQKVG
jgi:hypothetical protein